MNKKLTFEKAITIQAPVAAVWRALTTPAMIKQYLFGTETLCDWKKGSSIIFQGEWQGKSYVDKGVIIDIKPESFLHYTYWSGFSGLADSPENYSLVQYDLKPLGDATRFTLTQIGFVSTDARDHSATNWAQVLVAIKKLVEESK